MKLQKLGKFVFFGNFENDLYLEQNSTEIPLILFL